MKRKIHARQSPANRAPFLNFNVLSVMHSFVTCNNLKQKNGLSSRIRKGSRSRSEEIVILRFSLLGCVNLPRSRQQRKQKI